MTKRIILMRHAKSDWETDAPTDHERPLNRRGRQDAPRVAGRLIELKWTPKSVLSSDSQRTRETWELMSDLFPETDDAVFSPSLYHAGMKEIQDCVTQLSDDVRTVLLLGHNPGWQSAVRFFTGQYVSMTTCNAALLEGPDETWPTAIQLEHGWQLVDVVRPKEFA